MASSSSSSSSNEMESLFQCSHCENELNRESKSFPCLHSFCETCLNKEVKRKTNGIGHCPKCDEIGQLDELNLSPILISYLKCQKIESTDWKCDFCLDDQIESIATNWCENCEKFFCAFPCFLQIIKIIKKERKKERKKEHQFFLLFLFVKTKKKFGFVMNGNFNFIFTQKKEKFIKTIDTGVESC